MTGTLAFDALYRQPKRSFLPSNAYLNSLNICLSMFQGTAVSMQKFASENIFRELLQKPILPHMVG